MLTREVHIVPIARGSDSERVVAAVRGGDVVHLLYRGTSAKAELDAIRTQLEEMGIEVATTAYEVTDETPEIFSVFGLVTTIADQYDDEDTDVNVNVSAGTKRAAIGATLGCMDDGTDADAYIVDADGTTTEREQGEGSAVEAMATEFSYSKVPDYPIDSPTRDEMAILVMLASRNTNLSPAKKRTLIDRGIEVSQEIEKPLHYVEKILDDEDENVDIERRLEDHGGVDDFDSDERRGAYGHLRPILNELESNDYIRFDDENWGRSTAVELTPAGERALRAFRHKVTDVIDVLDNRSQPDWLTEGL